MTNPSQKELLVRELYRQLLQAWNQRDAQKFAALYEEDGNQIGFDGSQINGRAKIKAHLSRIFANHATAAYISLVQEVRFLNAETAILRAVAGMIPHGSADINPAVNAVQSVVAVKRENQWKVALFQNTPAAFDGRPEAAQQLTEELRQLLTKAEAK
jgi:uncharacterized protein (TIGR02246 family)